MSALRWAAGFSRQCAFVILLSMGQIMFGLCCTLYVVQLQLHNFKKSRNRHIGVVTAKNLPLFKIVQHGCTHISKNTIRNNSLLHHFGTIINNYGM
jgi:hypothetical protein